MKKYKRFFGFLLAAAMLFSLAACGQQAEGSNQTQDQGQEGPAQTPDDNTETQAPETEQQRKRPRKPAAKGARRWWSIIRPRATPKRWRRPSPS